MLRLRLPRDATDYDEYHNTMGPKVDSPLITIVMPVYNCQEYVVETIESLLLQTFKRSRIVIVNDCSTDDTLSLISRFSHLKNLVIVNLDRNVGESGAVNKGWALCETTFVAVISADDPQNPEWLASMFDGIRQSPNYLFYYPDVSVIDSSGNVIGVIETHDYNVDLLRNKLICLPSAGAIIDKSKLPQNFLPRIESVTHPSDLIQWLRLSNFGDGRKVSIRAGTWRQHSESLSSKDRTNRASLFRSGINEWISSENLELNSTQKLYLLGHQFMILKGEKKSRILLFVFRNLKHITILVHPKSYPNLMKFSFRKIRRRKS